MKKWTWIILAVALLVTLCSRKEAPQEISQEVLTAEAKEQLEMLCSREINYLGVFDFGDEYTISDTGRIEEILGAVRQMELEAVTTDYDAPGASSSMCVRFCYKDGTTMRLGQPCFLLETSVGKSVFEATIDGMDSITYLGSLFDSFGEEAEECLSAYREALLAYDFAEIEMRYEGIETQGECFINTKAELDAVRDMLQQAEFRTRGWSGKDAELMTLVIRCKNGEEHVLTLPCFDVKTSYGDVRCSVRPDTQGRMDEMLWDIFGN